MAERPDVEAISKYFQVANALNDRGLIGWSDVPDLLKYVTELEARLKAATERCMNPTFVKSLPGFCRELPLEKKCLACRADLALLDSTPEHPDVIDVEDIGTPEADNG